MRNVNQINEDNRRIVRSVFPEAYYDSMKSAIFSGDIEDKVIAYGKTSNCAWYEAAKEININTVS